jgi:flagellar motor switch protein FliN
MPDSAVPVASNEASAFLKLWSESLEQTLSQIAGKPYSISCSPSETSAAPVSATTDTWILIAMDGALRGEMAFRLQKNSAEALSQLFTGETGGDPEGANVKEALVELFRQVAGQFCTAAKPRFGECQARVESGVPPTWPEASSAWLAANDEKLGGVEARLSAALIATLRASETADSAPIGKGSEATLQTLMGVKLAISLRFGMRRMLLREILELQSGAVIELDREIHDPVELLLGERVIAKGEVVVIGGNYGLRVTEVSPYSASTQGD